MILALTGSTGFLGRHLGAKLAQRGHTLRALIRPSAQAPEWTSSDNVQCITGALGDDGQWVTKLLEGADVLVHLAAVGVQARDRDWRRATDLNVRESVSLVHEAHRHGVKHTVVTGTCLEYAGHGRLPDAPWTGQPAPLCDEDSPLEPSEAYGATKAAGGTAMRALARELGHALTYLRVASLYGSDDDADKLLPAALRTLRAAETFSMSPGAQVREWLHVDDACTAIAAAIEQPGDGIQTLNVGTGEGVTLAGLVTGLARALERPTELVRVGAKPYRPGEPHHLVMDVRRAQRALGWRATTDLRAGLRAMVAPASGQRDDV